VNLIGQIERGHALAAALGLSILDLLRGTAK
jgi:hypothetical protein